MEGMDWIDLAHNRDGWRAAVNAVMKFQFHKMREFLD
jgi:UDP-N-acetylmuramyl tripeptide synthase